jgi:hypothetical protein
MCIGYKIPEHPVHKTCFDRSRKMCKMCIKEEKKDKAKGKK